MIKRNLLILIYVVLILTVSCNEHNEKSGDGFVINGKIDGIKAKRIMIFRTLGDSIYEYQSADIQNYEFKFEGKMDYPELVFIIPEGFTEYISLFLENSHIQIDASINLLEEAHISGSLIHEQFTDFIQDYETYTDKESNLCSGYNKMFLERDTMIYNYIDSNCEVIKAEKLSFLMNYVAENKNSVMSAFVTSNILTKLIGLNDLEDIYMNLDDNLKKSAYAVDLKNYIDKRGSLVVGKKAPSILKDISTDSSIIYLEDYRDKFVLLNFWSSWCEVCYKDVEMIGKLKSNDLQLINISVDFDVVDYLTGIDNFDLFGIYICNFQVWDCPVVKEYFVENIPYYYLIDKEGVIIYTGNNIQKVIEKYQQSKSN